MKQRIINIFSSYSIVSALLLLILVPCAVKAGEAPSSYRAPSLTAAQADTPDSDTEAAQPIKKVLFIGDSMTGWMAERLNAYGEKNDFEVATVVWDGSTISKWASSNNLEKIIKDQAPDAIIVSLGMNEMFEQNPEARFRQPVSTLLKTFGDTPYLWIGPPSWPGHSEGAKFNNWMKETLGERNYFTSFDLVLPRQSKNNPHPTRQGIEVWIDRVMEWIPENSELYFGATETPGQGVMSRGDVFIYKRMKDSL